MLAACLLLSVATVDTVRAAQFRDAKTGFTVRLPSEFGQGKPTRQGDQVTTSYIVTNSRMAFVVVSASEPIIYQLYHANFMMGATIQRKRAKNGNVFTRERVSVQGAEGFHYVWEMKSEDAGQRAAGGLIMDSYELYPHGDKNRVADLVFVYPKNEMRVRAAEVRRIADTADFGPYRAPPGSQSVASLEALTPALDTMGKTLLVLCLLGAMSLYGLALWCVRRRSIIRAVCYAVLYNMFYTTSLNVGIMLAAVLPMLGAAGALPTRLMPMVAPIVLALPLLFIVGVVCSGVFLMRRIYRIGWKGALGLYVSYMLVVLASMQVLGLMWKDEDASAANQPAVRAPAQSIQPPSVETRDAGSPAQPTADASEGPVFDLQGISWMGDEAVAMVNGSFYAVGDRLAGHTVTRIEDRRVIMELPDGTERILTMWAD